MKGSKVIIIGGDQYSSALISQAICGLRYESVTRCSNAAEAVELLSEDRESLVSMESVRKKHRSLIAEPYSLTLDPDACRLLKEEFASQERAMGDQEGSISIAESICDPLQDAILSTEMACERAKDGNDLTLKILQKHLMNLHALQIEALKDKPEEIHVDPVVKVNAGSGVDIGEITRLGVRIPQGKS